MIYLFFFFKGVNEPSASGGEVAGPLPLNVGSVAALVLSSGTSNVGNNDSLFPYALASRTVDFKSVTRDSSEGVGWPALSVFRISNEV